MLEHPVVVIGAGPAGLSAAMQLIRLGISSLVLERNQIGGLLNNAYWVENYPGFVEGISGPDLVTLFQRQAERLGITVSKEEVLSVDYEDKLFRIGTNKRELQAEILVAATGTKPRKLPQDLFFGNFEGKVYTDVYPLLGEKGSTILITGAGDAALDYALNLAKHNQVVILNRGSQIKGLSLLWDRVQKNSSIEYFPEMGITKVIREDDGRISIMAGTGATKNQFECDYLVTAIGREPELGFAAGKFIKQMDQLQEEKKLFLIGDLHNGSFRQTALAVGDGIRSGMEIGQILEKG